MSRGVIAGVVLGVALVSGGLLMQSGAWREASATTSRATPVLLEQVMTRIRTSYVDSLATDELYRRTAFGFVKELDDPHSSVLTADALRRLRENTSGHYAGIGVEIDMRDGFLTVIAPIAGTPADSAGIEAGDRIAGIDSVSVVGLAMDEVQRRLRGPAGSRVTLKLEREAGDTTITLVRRDIVVAPVQRAENLPDGIAYVHLATFSERAAAELRRAVERLRADGAASLILDLRENPGGLLEQGIAVAELFLDPRQTVVRTRGRTPETNQDFIDQDKQLWPTMPIVVLVDSGTASAAEVVAGALQDNERAVLVGTATYGKGSAQSVFPLSAGRGLKLTTAKWFTPKGRTLERDSTKGGIEPDVTIAAQPATPDPFIARATQLLRGVASPADLRKRAL